MASPAVGAASALLHLLAFTVASVLSDGSDHRYKAGEPVLLYTSKEGPFHNASKTYQYFDLPFFSPGQRPDVKRVNYIYIAAAERFLKQTKRRDVLKSNKTKMNL